MKTCNCEELKTALIKLLDSYVALVKSGDAGNWNPENDEEVILARKALSSEGRFNKVRQGMKL